MSERTGLTSDMETPAQREERLATEAERRGRLGVRLGEIAAGDLDADNDPTVDEVGIEGMHTIRRARTNTREGKYGLGI